MHFKGYTFLTGTKAYEQARLAFFCAFAQAEGKTLKDFHTDDT